MRVPVRAADAGQGLERGADGVGVGVVGVVDHARARRRRSSSSIRHFDSAVIARRLRARRPPNADAGGQRRRGHGGGVVRLVLAEQPQLHALGRAAVAEVEARGGRARRARRRRAGRRRPRPCRT